MEQWRYNIDEQRYDVKDNHTMSLVGWYVSPKIKECVFHLVGNEQTEIPVEKPERFARPDVNASWGEDFGEYTPGFKLDVPKAPEIFKEYKTLKLVLSGDGEDKCIWSKTYEEIKTLFDENNIEICLDRVDVLYDSVLEIQGWAVNYEGDVNFSITDENGNPAKCKIAMGRRPDVVGYKELDDSFRDKEIGFRVSAPLDELKLDRIVLHFTAGKDDVTHLIDIKKIREEKKAHQKELRRQQGNFFQRLFNRGEVLEGYDLWKVQHSATPKELKAQRRTRFAKEPLISIAIPLYETPIPFLDELLVSIQKQTYKNWQLCLADGSPKDTVGDHIRKKYGKDKRIVYKKLTDNAGISTNTNEAIALATGDYLILSDHDDVLEPDALYEIVKAINENENADVLYTDEDKVSMDGKHYFDPNFKPDFNLFRLRDNNYICHIFVVKKSLTDEVGLLRPEFDGAQDFDFILRCCEKAQGVIHIPKALYHWRCHMNSTAADPASKMYAYEAGKKAVEEHYKRLGIEAEVTMEEPYGWYRSHVKIIGEPLISIIIPTKDHTDDLDLCLSSITERSTWKNYEILVVENNSDQEETFQYYETMSEKYPKARLLKWPREFNYSAINNFAAREAKGEYLIFLNNDTEIITPQWMEEMLMICQQDDVSAVGVKLFYPDDTIQHAGVVIGLGGIASHIMCGAPREDLGYCGRLISVQEISAVTAACMMMRTYDFRAVGGFDESFAVAFNDIDLCMKIREMGKKIVFTPYAQLYHYESKSRGMENTPEKHNRFRSEIERFEKKWNKVLAKCDPYYSPNLSKTEGDCSLAEED